MSRKAPRDHLFLNIEQIKNGQQKSEEIYATQVNPSSATKKRKIKSYRAQTSQQKISQSYGELMHYIDNLDERVQQIIKTYQVQFLQAYNSHIKKVKRQMQELIHNSMNNANSQKALQQKIDSMQKQLKVFRQQSLKLFEKLVTKDKQLNSANIKIKELQKENKQYQKTIYQLSRRTKELQILSHHHKIEESANQQIQEDHFLNNEFKLQIGSLVNKNFKSMANRSKSYYVQQKKSSRGSIIDQKSNLNLQFIDKQSKAATIKNTILFNQTQTQQRVRGIRTMRQAKTQSVQRKSQMKRDEMLKIKSFEFSERDKYLKIFKNCVQQLKDQINRRGKNVSLNFFKENGPKDFVQFRRQDNFKLLSLLLSNQTILMEFYRIVFNREANF